MLEDLPGREGLRLHYLDEGPPDAKQTFWNDLAAWMYGPRLFQSMITKFAQSAADRFGDKLSKIGMTSEVLVVRDRTKYAIGPHTDAPHRFLSMLFYCPRDSSHEHLGTSLYLPLDPKFTCEGGPHYDFDKFVKVDTMPFRPNSLFCFVRTDRSFHGVEPITDDAVARDLILYDIRITNPDVLQAGAGAEEAPALVP